MTDIRDGATVAGAIAVILRATDPDDPGFEMARRCYGAALEAAGLVEAETSWAAGDAGLVPPVESGADVDQVTAIVGKQWIHRATWSDGTVTDSKPRPFRPGQEQCLAGISESVLRQRDPGVTVTHLVRDDSDEEWREQ